MKKLLFFAAMTFLYSLSGVSHAEFYKWVDENGVTRISNAGAPEKYKDNTSKSEEAKYADQPQLTKPQKENIVIINNNYTSPAATSPPPTTPKDNTNEMIMLERNRLQELAKSQIAPDDIRTGSDSKKRERWEKREKHRRDKANKDLKALNNDSKQYFYNKPEEDARERDWQAEDVREEVLDRKRKPQLGITPSGQIIPIIPIN